MNIRTSLALRFSLIAASILVLFSLSIYYFSASYRQDEFYTRLTNKALTTAKLLIEVNEVDHDLLKIIDKNTINALYQEKVVIYNYKNEQIYNSLDSGNIPVTKELLDKIRIEQEVRFRIGDQEAIGIGYNDRYNRFVVIAAAYDKYGLSKLNFLRIILFIGLIVAVSITMLAGYFYSKQALKPISKVVDQVDKITISNLNERVQTPNENDEIGQLASNFNRMLERLEAAFRMQQSFVSNASHELRTPLTVITGEIDLALMHDREKEEYKKILSTISQDIKNLNTLSNGLLDLAQASQDIAAFRLAEVRIDELLLQSRIEIVKKHPAYTVNIRFDLQEDNEFLPVVWGSEPLLKSAFSNLIENACKFSNDHRVEVVLSPSPGEIIVSFSDKGIGISPDDIDKIFDPFYRAFNGRDKKGHGIGLSLTRKIVEMHKGSIHVTSGIRQGSTFTITLPIS